MLARIRFFTVFFIIGLVLSGATAIPLVSEVDWLASATGARQMLAHGSPNPPAWALWLCKVQDAIHLTAEKNPFLSYGTDWLAFGHFAIALAFIGALRDPVRNKWLFSWGMIACGLLIPYALVFGAIRGIPLTFGPPHPKSLGGHPILVDHDAEVITLEIFRRFRAKLGAWIETSDPARVLEALGVHDDEPGVIALSAGKATELP